MMLFVTGCGTMAGSATNDLCTLTAPIQASSQDTDETLRQILEFNTKWERLCN